ncbi:MAG TPA: cyclase family protein [Burkholderiales bacterium]|nr:cyclase family protein [Burkholderiales bacterium]
MRLNAIAVAITAVCLGAGSAAAQTLKGPVNDAPLTEHWAPTKWGADDKAGSANHTKNSANIKRALATVKQFKSITVGKFYHWEMPVFGPRTWRMSIPGTPTGGPFGKNALVYHDETVFTEIGQVGTQFDGPGHIGVNTSKGPFMYNGRISWDIYERGAGGRVMGMGPQGVEFSAELGFVCRLVVLDAVAYKKSKGLIPASAEMLPIPHKPGDPGIVTADDIKGIIKMEGLQDVQPGDCVALHTGQGNTWSNDRYQSMSHEQRKAARDIFAQGEPGFGLSACEWFHQHDVALTMGDTSANDAQPGNEVEGWAVPCHTQAQVRYGIWNLENVDTKSLVDNHILEGAFIWAPLRIIGATGSPGNPIVLY